METTTGLAEAIEKIQETAQRAAELHTVPLTADDGANGKVNAAIIVTRDDSGRPCVAGLTEFERAASALAKELRLAKAAGPDFRSGLARHQSIESFIVHANRFKAANSAVWADPSKRDLVSVLDYHPEGHASPARWGRHRGVYPCPLSEAWQAWGGVNGLELDQDEFAELLDSRDLELSGGKLPSGATAPEPSYLVTLAHNLEVYSTATAKRERDPSTGRLKVSYSEDKGVGGTIMPPAAFLITIPIFEDSKPTPLEVRLRVTVEEGKAKFHVRIHAATQMLRLAFGELCERVAKETGLPVFHGTPEL